MLARLALCFALLATLAPAAAAQGVADAPPPDEAVGYQEETPPAAEAAPLDTLTSEDVLSEGAQELVEEHGATPPVFLVLPFVALLLMIATGPLFYPHHWHHHYPKWAVGLGLAVSVYYLLVLNDYHPIFHAAQEYFSFIALLASLYIASGGILIKTDFAGTPKANAALLFVGGVIANVIGTTGASMLLIRPFMRLNRGRIKAYHIIFFIFIVSNVGGALTPIGDPPLFLGFLRGVPFFWTVTHVWYIWLPTILVLLGVFYVIDSRNKAESVREEVEEATGRDIVPGDLSDVPPEPTRRHITITGAKNFGWLAVVIAAVFIDPSIFPGVVPDLVQTFHVPFGIREILMFGVCWLAYRTANPEALRGNDFNFEPIKEVGYLFIGIFLTMQPALELIRLIAAAPENAAVLNETMFYWATGALSGILDNAPTYVSFLSAAMGKFGLDVNVIADVREFADPVLSHPDSWFYLQAISVAAVFFGAMTYIGNGPNFMVKAIAESSGVDCPSFGGYIVKYSLPILVPIYAVVWFVFYSGYVVDINPHNDDLEGATSAVEAPALPATAVDAAPLLSAR